jgi:hypothetical protein
MIISNDLRTGNYVKAYMNGKKKLVHLSAQDIATIERGKLEVFPVALVKEWLEKFQFVYTETSCVHFKFTYSRLEQRKDGFYFMTGKNQLNRFPILYVHQLQNAFYWMAGEDLDNDG